MSDDPKAEWVIRRMLVINENTEWIDSIQKSDSTPVKVNAETWDEWLDSTVILRME